MVDASGRLFNGDELLYVLAADRLAHRQAKGKPRGTELGGVVGTLMTNLAVELGIQRLGYEFVRAKVGDRYVLEELHRRGWILGGEGSGHLTDRKFNRMRPSMARVLGLETRSAKEG